MSDSRKPVALITGAASGLGRTLALDLAASGSNLGLFDRNIEQLEETGRLCAERGSEAVVVPGDVTRPEDCQRFVESSTRRLGGVDALINNAGVSMWARFEDIQELSVFARLVEVNYLGVVYCTYHALPHLRLSRGSLVAISSIQGKIAVPFHSGYVASKHAVQGFFNTLRTELRGSGIHILLVLPHWLTGTGLRAAAYGRDGAALGQARTQHSKESVSVEVCSKAILQAMNTRQRELVIPSKLKVLPWLALLSPGLVDYIVASKVDEQRQKLD